jgi:methionyl-tRNA formyltransferase
MNISLKDGASAVVFAYHDIGVRCLASLLELGIDVRLVVTHTDSETEQIWFGSVAELALFNGIEVITPDSPNTAAVIEQVSACAPDFIFSFYYRQMLSSALLAIPRMGAFNVHGSLLPKYRGRVPVNWAIIHGEEECGVSLHRMVEKPDAGDLMAQRSVPILRNDTAFDVFQKLKCAAELMLMETVPPMVAGRLDGWPMDLEKGSYFGGRKPQDGLIDWGLPAWDIHNLVRAVAPPFPGAFFDIGGHRLRVLSSYYRDEPASHDSTCIYVDENRLYADCADGKRFMLARMEVDGNAVDGTSFERLFGDRLEIGRELDS